MESVRIAETLRGGHDETVKRRKSYLEDISDSIRVREAPAICKCIATYSFGNIAVGDEIDIVQFLSRREQSQYKYIVRKEAVMNIVDWDDVIFLGGTKVQFLGTSDRLLDGKFGRIIGARNGSSGRSYTVHVTSLNRVVTTKDCYVVNP